MMELSPNELRVIGCLIEKSLTTPDQYPLSVNALTNACNQKSNREPVMSLSELEVQNTLDELAGKGLVMNQSGASSRVTKYKHRFCNTEFSELQLSPQELGIICVLFLRGPQTPGELRTRTNRLCEFADVRETEQVLNQLCAVGPNGQSAKVIKLTREPGKRESRYAHCFADNSESELDQTQMADEPNLTSTDAGSRTANPNQSSHQPMQQSNLAERVSELEEQVALLQLELEELHQKLS